MAGKTFRILGGPFHLKRTASPVARSAERKGYERVRIKRNRQTHKWNVWAFF